ncbi:MAG: hypothetical protein LBV51_05485 [Acholeplasmatales bacterium]|jgi:superoxide reductase|nr:hypothetical protein [Acholeplasmatales bacterium]
MKFYICKHCGNIVAYVKDNHVKIVCCGEVMEELVPKSADAALEKHVPVVTKKGNVVNVHIGSVDHPMTEAHHIEWVALETVEGNQRKLLTLEKGPNAVFSLTDGDKVVAAYEYCNLHGLWKTVL